MTGHYHVVLNDHNNSGKIISAITTWPWYSDYEPNGTIDPLRYLFGGFQLYESVEMVTTRRRERIIILGVQIVSKKNHLLLLGIVIFTGGQLDFGRADCAYL